MTINTHTQFFSDLTDSSRAINFNGNEVALGYYNLILSIRDVSLYAVGIKPHRNWKISDVKKYFGLKGDATQLKEQLKAIKTQLDALLKGE